MKRILYKVMGVFFVLGTMFSFVGCWNSEYDRYPVLERTKEGDYIYNGNRYISTDAIEYNPFELGYHMNYEELQMVGITQYLIFSVGQVYVSDLDVDHDVLYITGRGGAQGYWLKEGFEVPNVETAEIEKVSISASGCQKKIYVNCSDEGLKYQDIIDCETIREEGSNLTDQGFQCFVKLMECDSLNYCGLRIVEEEGIVYLKQLFDFEESRTLYIFYKIKDEYQEVFRNAITELETLVETSESAT